MTATSPSLSKAPVEALARPESHRGWGRALLAGRLRPYLWLGLLALVCLGQTVTHLGRHNGFLASSRPTYYEDAAVPADGYLTWAGTVPVLYDAHSFLVAVAMFAGEHGPEQTGIYDRRAGYSYLASLVVPWTGAYAGFVLLNTFFWWAATAAMYWLVVRRWHDAALAMTASLLIAIGNGFVFMVGLPMSYTVAYAGVVLLLALTEATGVFRGRSRLSSWLLLGWGAGVASLLYFTHLVLLGFWGLYGLRRVPWRHLLAAAVVAFAIETSWEAFGRSVVGMAFVRDNSNVLTESLRTWVERFGDFWPTAVTFVRSTLIVDTLLGAFPAPWWLLAGIGFLRSTREDREWLLAVAMPGLASALVIVSTFALPRIAYYMFPAVAILAARGALSASGLVEQAARRATGSAGVARVAAVAFVAAVALGLAVLSNLDLFGIQLLNVRFHFRSLPQ